MKRFHICYLIAKNLCTGKNITALNYSEAIEKFNESHGNQEILYVTTLVA